MATEHDQGHPPPGAELPSAPPPAQPAAAAPRPGGGGALDLIYGVLFQPRTVFPRLAGRPPLGFALAVVLVTAAVQGFTTGQELAAQLDLPIGVADLRSGLAVLLGGVGLFSWLLSAGLGAVFAELLGGQGSARTLLALLGLASLPALFGPVFATLGRLTGSGLFDFLSLPVLVWLVILNVLAVRTAYRLSAGRAMAVLFGSGLALTVSAFLAVGLTLAVLVAAGLSLGSLAQ